MTRPVLSVVLAAAVSLPALGAGCRPGGAGSPAPPTARAANRPAPDSHRGAAPAEASAASVVFVLFDLSGSTSARRIRERYLEDFETILATAGGGELVIGDAITDNTMATATYPLRQLFPRYDSWRMNRLSHRKKMGQALDAARAQAKKLILETPASPRTDLMNAFQLADKVFNGDQCRGAADKRLVVFSDMMDQSRRYNSANEKLGTAGIQRILRAEREAGRLPELRSVKVWVAGATAAASGGIDPDRIYQVQRFWLQYFKACGADLTKERYATRLLGY